MTSTTVVLRFVGEPSQFSFTERPPEIGDVQSHDGDEWEVVDVREMDGNLVATLRRVPDQQPVPA